MKSVSRTLRCQTTKEKKTLPCFRKATLRRGTARNVSQFRHAAGLSLGDKPRFANDLPAVDRLAARHVLLTAIETGHFTELARRMAAKRRKGGQS